MKKIQLLALLFLASLGMNAHAHSPKEFSIIAYYDGDCNKISQYDVSKLTHIIFSFCHLKDGKLNVDKAKDTLTIRTLVALKDKNPKLKVMLSMGGWSACAPCSEAFSTAEGREKFAKSVKEVNDYFKTDGLDLDWEYPAVVGFPGHMYQAADKPNFTELLKILRQTIGDKNELSFAAGATQRCLDNSIEWAKVAPYVDRINIMNYDLVGGYSKISGHDSPLYTTYKNEESTDRAVSYIINAGVPAHKLVIGGAFYVRIWKNASSVNNGLYQAGETTSGVDYNRYPTRLTTENGWTYYWDTRAMASYWYNEKDKMFASGDNKTSMKAKTAYAKKKMLGGMMFWELTLDTPRNGLLDVIYKEARLK
jgi:chitinase